MIVEGDPPYTGQAMAIGIEPMDRKLLKPFLSEIRRFELKLRFIILKRYHHLLKDVLVYALFLVFSHYCNLVGLDLHNCLNYILREIDVD